MNAAPDIPDADRHVLVLGAYGLIGSGVVRALCTAGFTVTGLGRDRDTAERVLPTLPWVIADLSTLTDAQDWHPLLDGVSHVVNCSGALQDGPEDHLDAVHHHAIAALAEACAAADVMLVQISAVGARPEAKTAFLASKARGDAAIAASGARHVIFRPGLVLAPHGYGGTALLRMLAAVPIVQPLALPDARLQTISLTDLASAITAALRGDVPDGTICDLVEDEAHSLPALIAATRRWLGFRPARWTVTIPKPAVRAISFVADKLSLLGWRSPLRSTSIRVLSDGVRGDPAQWSALGLHRISSMAETFGTMQANVETRLHARMTLLMPLLVATLSLFWGLSGLIGLLKVATAAEVLTEAGWPFWLAALSVVFWAVIDLTLAAAILIRKYAKRACIGMIAVSLIYLVAASVVAPALWLDPLGPLVKVLPAILLALIARVALDTR